MEKNHGQKVQRFSIRKYSFGAASVAVAAYMMFGGVATVQADAQVTPSTASDSQTAPDAGNQADSTKPLASTETVAPTAEQPSAPAETPKSEEAPAKKADTSKLEAAIARMEAALEKAGLTEKTASAIEAAKAELAKAQSLLSNEKATQTEVDYSTSSLKNRAFVLESMPKATAEKKEEKENKNQDSRNGQAIPGQGESGFRAVDTTAANSAEEATKYKGARDAALPELEANIAKIKAELAAEEGKAANKQDLAKIDTYKKVIEKAEGIATAAKAADATSAKEMSKQAEAVKSERDLLKLYLEGKADLGAPVSENHAGYGNNPSNGVFESLKEGFGNKVTFTDADKKSFTVAKQYESGRDLTNKIKNLPDAKDPIGSATYNWQEKAITKADAEAGMLNGWKIENGEKVNVVKPLDVTNVTDKDGQPSDREVWKSKVYTNDGELIKYQTSGEVSYVNGSGLVPLAMPTITGRASADPTKRVLGMQNNTFGEVKNRDYYLELGSQGTILSKEYDVNGNSRINVSLIHSGAYGGSTATDAGERVKLKIVDAFTGAEIKPLDGKDGAMTTEQGPYSGTGWTHLDRIYDIPKDTTKIKVLIEAGEQGSNTLINNNNIKLKDGYIIGGIGIATSPAAEVVTNVRSQNKEGEYGYTKDTIYEKGQKGVFDIDIKNTGGMNIDYYADTTKSPKITNAVEVTVKVPKGVTLEDKIYTANGGSNWLGHTYANNIRWEPNDPNDNTQGGTIKYRVPAGNRMPAAEAGSRKTEINFTTTDNFIGPADFKVTVKSGFGDRDALGNRLYSYDALGLEPAYSNLFNPSGLAKSDDPDFVYGRVIFINSLQANSVVTVPINTTDDQLKAIAYAKAQEAIKTPEFTKLLNDVTGTAALGDTNGSTFVNKDNLAITKVAEDGRGVVKVPVTYTVDGKTFETTVDIEVNVVESKTKPVVVFEGDEITPASVKEKVEPKEIDGKKGTANEPKATDIFKTDGKAGETGLTIPTTVTHNVNGTEITENVTVPVTVLPRTEGEVDVPKGTTPDKVKETLKAKAEELIKTPDFPSKVPEGYTVTVGEIPELPKDIANKKGEPVVVKVPVTFTSPDGTTYTSEIPVTVNVKGSEVKPVYVVEGQKPDPAKVKEAVTPDKGGTVQDPTDANLPDTTGKAGATDVVVPTTVKYPTGDETVNVPVKVVKGYPQLVAVSEDKKQPSPEDNIDTSDYPDDATYEYKEEVDTTAPGDKKVTVVVKQGDKVLVEVPATVRVVDSKPQFVVADPKKPQPDVKASITPDEYPTGTEFEYKEPVDTTTAGEKEVTVVAKLDGKTIVEVPAKVMVVDPKTQYVFEDPAKSQPSADESIDPDQYPEGTKFTYKDGEVDTTTPGDKKVTVVAKDGEDKLVEVPAVVKVLPLVKPEGLTVLKGSENLEAAVKAKAEEVVAALPKDKLPEGVTVKVKEVKAGTTPTTAEVTETGKPKPATVVVEYTDDKGNVIGTKEVEVPVTVIGSTPKSVVVFEGTTPEKDKVKESVTPGQGGTVGEPTTLPETAGKAGATDVTVEVPVTYPGMKDSEKVTVPVTVLPVAKADVTVAKNTTPDKLKELAKAKADEAIKAKDFTSKLPKDAKVTVGDVTKAIEETVTAKKGTGVTTVEVPVTYTVDGKDYTTTIPVTVNVKGSDVKPVYVVEGDKPTAADVNNAITPDTDGTKTPVTDEDINKAIPTTEGKVGANDIKVTTKVTYKDGGEETVEVPVTVLPKVSPEGVVVPKDTDKATLEKAVKDKVEEVAKNVKGLPEGVTVTVKETPLTTPGTETPGEKDSVTVTIEYKDKGGNVIATKEVKVPVTVTPKVTPIVVEVGTPITKEDVKKHIELPNEKGWEIVEENWTIPTTETAGQKPSVKAKVKLPSGKEITVEVPVTVTPKKETPAPKETVKVTPIVVEVGTPVTKEDVIKHIELPKGAEILEIGEIPTTETAGQKPSVKVKVKLPNGDVVEVEVPVTVVPKQTTPGTERPSTPEVKENTQTPKAPVVKEGEKVLPNTGIADNNSVLAGFGLAILGLAGMVRRRKQK